MTEHLQRRDSLDCSFFTEELNHYFLGKYMTARDFECDQAYFRSRQRFANRLLDGWGVVGGLDVAAADQRECPGWVTVGAGVAIDPAGRLLVLKSNRRVELEPGRAILLALRYEETPIEPVPALLGDASCDPESREMNRIRETAQIVAVPPERLPPGGWPGTRPWPSPGTANGDAAEDAAGLGSWRALVVESAAERASLAARCVVPLAYIGWRPEPSAGNGKGKGETLYVVTAGRRFLATDTGTRITSLSWPHAGAMKLDVLKTAGGALTVRFSKPLCGDANGVCAETFALSYWDDDNRLIRVPPDASRPPGRCANAPDEAFFCIDGDSVAALAGRTIHVVLRCDFIRDIDGCPVDGNHFGGTMPTGNGVPGGTFESWFRIDAGKASKSAAAPDADRSTQ